MSLQELLEWHEEVVLNKDRKRVVSLIKLEWDKTCDYDSLWSQLHYIGKEMDHDWCLAIEDLEFNKWLKDQLSELK